jgi:hypothetical protein
MSESAIKSNQREAQELFTRGVAAARSGQKRMAGVLLSRAVQLDPRHEQAWLWLSGVIDEPERVAFCLRSVLSINPHNERAIQGLAWLDQRSRMKPPAPPTLPAVMQSAASEALEPESDGRWSRLRQLRRMRRARRAPQHEMREQAPWWVGWRRSRREMSRAWVLVWSTLIVVWLLLLGLNYTLQQTIDEHRATVQAAAAEAASQANAPTAVPDPVFESNLDVTQDAAVLAYLSKVDPPREQLRAAVQTYREATSKPGGALVTHVEATRTLRDQIENTYNALSDVDAPPMLEQAHTHYLAGLKQEQSAMDDMLEFYGSYGLQFANRATVRLLDAGEELERAKAIFQHYQQQANDPQRHAAATVR